MLRGFLDTIEEPPARIDGIVISDHRENRGLNNPSSSLHHLTAAHPLPDSNSHYGGRLTLETAKGLGGKDRALVLISGGGSSLLEAPVADIDLKTIRNTTRALLNSGRPIGEVNCVRKHLSRLKGGRLGKAIAPAAWHTLAVSDVVGDSPATIASGPTVSDPTTFQDALSILRNRRLQTRGSVPSSALRWLAAGAKGRRLETPARFRDDTDRRNFSVIASLPQSIDAAEITLRKRKVRVAEKRHAVRGEASKVAERFAQELHSLASSSESSAVTHAIVWGGEVHVTLHTRSGDDSNTPKGGPCQEFALAAGLHFSSLTNDHANAPVVAVGALSTDGVDGPTDAAGAIVSPDQFDGQRRHHAEEALDQHKSYSFLREIGALVRTGPTGTNVNDLYIGIVNPRRTTANMT